MQRVVALASLALMVTAGACAHEPPKPAPTAQPTDTRLGELVVTFEGQRVANGAVIERTVEGEEEARVGRLELGNAGPGPLTLRGIDLLVENGWAGLVPRVGRLPRFPLTLRAPGSDAPSVVDLDVWVRVMDGLPVRTRVQIRQTGLGDAPPMVFHLVMAHPKAPLSDPPPPAP